MESINEEIRGIENIEGFLPENEGQLLYDLASNAENPIVEIGSWKGKSTICLAKGSKDGNKVYAIDHHQGSSEHGDVNTLEEFRRNLKSMKVKDDVNVIIKKSEEAIEDFDKEIGLLWIDGAHEYENVKFDFENWSKYLVEEGIVAFHDCTKIGKTGPYEVINEKLIWSDQFSQIKFEGLITYAKKEGSRSTPKKFWDQLRFYIYAHQPQINRIIPEKLIRVFRPLFRHFIK